MADGKEKTYHINLMKKYFRRSNYSIDRPSDIAMKSGSVAVIDDGGDEKLSDNCEGDAELISLFPALKTQTIDDVKIDDELPDEKKSQFNR